MEMSQAATFLGASILISIGLIIITLMVLILNNLFSMFWKPVKLFKYSDPYYDKSAPLMEKTPPTLEPFIDLDPALDRSATEIDQGKPKLKK